MRLAMEDVLYNNGVDIVLNGHCHEYERSNPVYVSSLVSEHDAAWPSASLINFSPKFLSCDFHSQLLACSRNRYVTEVSPSSTLCCVMYNAYAVLLQLLCLMEFVQVLWAY